jgi:hypothetical protein
MPVTAGSRPWQIAAWQQPWPVVAGESGLAGSWPIPFVRLIRSDSTPARHDLPNWPVHWLRYPHLAGTPAGSPRWRYPEIP